MQFIFKMLSKSWFVASGILLLCTIALSTAYFFQYVVGLRPCILCLYQRVPYATNALLSLIALIFSLKNKDKIATGFIWLCALVFFINSGIAFYHTGVEQLWWAGFSTCNGPAMPENASVEEILAALEKSPLGRCDEIPWKAPIIGLSMANLNTIGCFFFGLGSIVSAVLIGKKKD